MRRSIQRADWERRIEQQLRSLNDLTAGCESLLDLGCGRASPASSLRGIFKTGVDGWEPSIAAARELGTHDELICSGIFDYLEGRATGSVDAVVALDVIEHMEKPLGHRLLKEMERVAKRRVIVSTPNGFLAQEGVENPMQRHVCGWSPSEFAALGYQVSGLYGPKWLRSRGHELRRFSSILLGCSWASASFVQKRPFMAAGLICSRVVA